MLLSYRKLSLSALLLVPALALATAQDPSRGRKYTPPPPVSHITVTVTKGLNHKPVENASVIFHTMRNGHDDGNLEVKTNEEGRAIIDVIPIGETVRLQVIKTGFQTYGEDFAVDSPARDVAVKLQPPARQFSSYERPAEPASGGTAPQPAQGTSQPPQ